MLPDVGVIALVPDVWGGVWQPRHQVLTRLARYFHVVWCDQPRGWRYVLTADARRGRPIDVDSQPTGFTVYRPPRWLPAVGVETVGRRTFRERLRQARQILRSAGCRTVILYLWRPEHGSSSS